MLREETPRLGLWLDTSNVEVEDTVTHILEGLAVAAVAPGDLVNDA